MDNGCCSDGWKPVVQVFRTQDGIRSLVGTIQVPSIEDVDANEYADVELVEAVVACPVHRSGWVPHEERVAAAREEVKDEHRRAAARDEEEETWGPRRPYND